MAETIEFTEEVEQKANVLVEGVRKAYLFSLGTAVATLSYTGNQAKNARTNLSNLSTKMVARGEEADNKTRSAARKFVDDQKESRKKELKSAQKRLEKTVGKRMESVLHTVNIPSKADINSLSNKVTRLNKKVDELNKPA